MIPARLKLLLFNLLFSIPIICFSQSAGKYRNVDVGGGEMMGVFKPADSTTGPHWLMITLKGAGEVNTLNLTPGSIGAYCAASPAASGRFMDDIKGGYETGYIMVIHSTGTIALIKTAIAWAKTNLAPYLDTTQMYMTGLSLGGGPGTLIAGSDTVGLGSLARRLAGVAIASPVFGAGYWDIYPGTNKTNLPLIIIDANNDDNSNTNHIAQDILAGKQSFSLTATPEPKFYFPNNNNTAYQANGSHRAGWQMLYDTTPGNRSTFLDSSLFTGYSNTNATVSVRNFYEQLLTYSKDVALPPTVGTRTDVRIKRVIKAH